MKPKVIEAKIADLHPYDNNPRVNEEAVPAIVKSIEEFGFIGTAVITVLLFIIVYRCFDNARSLSHNAFGELMCIGVGAMLLFHITENIGMCLGLMPITGIPLPFISYGGSSMITTFVALGILQSVSGMKGEVTDEIE